MAHVDRLVDHGDVSDLLLRVAVDGHILRMGGAACDGVVFLVLQAPLLCGVLAARSAVIPCSLSCWVWGRLASGWVGQGYAQGLQLVTRRLAHSVTLEHTPLGTEAQKIQGLQGLLHDTYSHVLACIRIGLHSAHCATASAAASCGVALRCR